ncbi:hypothetical protein LCGC14_1532880 [marine sediment metagenome]|uniref:Fibronectin type-III domain-containing protein n=1 Tax=marine sediment metagenome TaxID=412755 RepID=A0A0F9IVG2_9ZZZZ
MKKFKAGFALLSMIFLLAIVPYAHAFDYTGPGKDVTFAWDANTEADLAGYRIYWAATSGGHLFAIDNGTQFQEVLLATPPTGFDPALPGMTVPIAADGDYYWVAIAFDAGGYESGPSSEISTQIDNPPAPPGGFRQTAVTAKLEFKLFWSPQYKTVRLTNTTTANLKTK